MKRDPVLWCALALLLLLTGVFVFVNGAIEIFFEGVALGFCVFGIMGLSLIFIPKKSKLSERVAIVTFGIRDYGIAIVIVSAVAALIAYLVRKVFGIG